MASAAKELRYSNTGMVYGDLAYDLDRELRERQFRQRRGSPPAPGSKGTAAGPPGDRVQTRERQKLSVLTVLGFGAAAALAVLVLMSYIQLMGISNSVVSLKSQLEDLETENVTLTTQYERMYDLTTVQEAAEAAGMSKPSGSQIYYIDLSDGDSAVVYQQKEPDVLSRLLTSLHHGVYAVVEYFE